MKMQELGSMKERQIMSFHQDEQKENSQEIVIPLTQGKVTRISRDDEHFAQYKWYFNAKRGYVQRDREKD